MNKVQLASSCLFLAALTISHTATAKQCDELYPIADGEDYYQVDVTPLAKDLNSQLHQFAKKLHGRWHGVAMEVECGVSNGESLTVVSNYDLSAEIEQHFEGSILVRTEKDSKDKLVLDKMYISPEIDRQRNAQKTGSRNYNIEFTGPNSFVFSDTYRARSFGTVNHAGGSSATFQRMVHEVKSVKLENNKLKINRDIYVNGAFVSQQEWLLTRY